MQEPRDPNFFMLNLPIGRQACFSISRSQRRDPETGTGWQIEMLI